MSYQDFGSMNDQEVTSTHAEFTIRDLTSQNFVLRERNKRQFGILQAKNKTIADLTEQVRVCKQALSISNYNSDAFKEMHMASLACVTTLRAQLQAERDGRRADGVTITCLRHTYIEQSDKITELTNKLAEEAYLRACDNGYMSSKFKDAEDYINGQLNRDTPTQQLRIEELTRELSSVTRKCSELRSRIKGKDEVMATEQARIRNLTWALNGHDCAHQVEQLTRELADARQLLSDCYSRMNSAAQHLKEGK